MSGIVIENLGPITRLPIELPEAGGVVVLKGHNGAGKSTALDTISAALGNKARPSVRDGAKAGSFDGLGLRMNISRTSRKTGELLCDTIEGRLDIGDLVDPGLVNAEAADTRRIKAILSLTGVKPDLAMFEGLIPAGDLREMVPPELTEKDDILALAARVKRAIELKARAEEGAAQRNESEAIGLDKSVAEIDLNADCDSAALQERLEECIRAESILRERHEAGTKATEQAADAQAILDSLSQTVAGDVLEQLRIRTAALTEANCRLSQAQEALRFAEEERKTAFLAHADASAAAAKLTNQQRLLDKSRAALAEAQKVKPVPPELLEAAAKDTLAARQAVELGALVREAKQTQKKALTARAAADQSRAKAEQWRQAAAGIDEVLSDQVSKLNTPLKVRIREGVVQMVIEHHIRGEVRYAELSDGERYRVAIDLAAEVVGTGGALRLNQAAWEALDPDNRAAVDAHAKARGVTIFTAEATAGALRSEVFEPELAAAE